MGWGDSPLLEIFGCKINITNMKLTNLIIAALLITNVVSCTLLYQRSVALQKWEKISDGLDPTYVGEAAKAIRDNEKFDGAIREYLKVHKIKPTSKKCQTSLQVLRMDPECFKGNSSTRSN